MQRSLTAALLLSAGLASGQSILKFEKDTIDTGLVVIETDSLGHETNSTYRSVNFTFKNTGNEPLIIVTGIGSGNGLADFPKDPVLPGKTGTIKATIYRFKYTSPIQKDGLHAFTTGLLIQGNFAGKEKYIYVKGYTKKVVKR